MPSEECLVENSPVQESTLPEENGDKKLNGQKRDQQFPHNLAAIRIIDDAFCRVSCFMILTLHLEKLAVQKKSGTRWNAYLDTSAALWPRRGRT